MLRAYMNNQQNTPRNLEEQNQEMCVMWAGLQTNPEAAQRNVTNNYLEKLVPTTPLQESKEGYPIERFHRQQVNDGSSSSINNTDLVDLTLGESNPMIGNPAMVFMKVFKQPTGTALATRKSSQLNQLSLNIFTESGENWHLLYSSLTVMEYFVAYASEILWEETAQLSLLRVLRTRLKQGEGNIASKVSWFDEKRGKDSNSNGGGSLNSRQGVGLNFDGVGNDMALQIDKDPRCRHFIVHGHETSQRLLASNILISGKITKNLICVGTESVTLHDGVTKELWNLSNRFVGSKEELEESGPLAYVQRMQGLDISVTISMLTSELAQEQSSDLQGVASTNIFLEKIVEFDDYPYQYQSPLAFIKLKIETCFQIYRIDWAFVVIDSGPSN